MVVSVSCRQEKCRKINILAGGASVLNEALNNPTDEWDYGQIAIDSFYGSAHGFVDAMTMGKGRPLIATCKATIAGCWAASDSIHREEPVDKFGAETGSSICKAIAVQEMIVCISYFSKATKPSMLVPIYYGGKMLSSPLIRFGTVTWKNADIKPVDMIKEVLK